MRECRGERRPNVGASGVPSARSRSRGLLPGRRGRRASAPRSPRRGGRRSPRGRFRRTPSTPAAAFCCRARSRGLLRRARLTTIVTCFTRRPTSCPWSTSADAGRRRTRVINEAALRPDSARARICVDTTSEVSANRTEPCAARATAPMTTAPTPCDWSTSAISSAARIIASGSVMHRTVPGVSCNALNRAAIPKAAWPALQRSFDGHGRSRPAAMRHG
jgi:hypothetical protein